MTRRINAAGLSHVKSWEKQMLTAYLDIAGVLTVGYGSTGKHVKPGMKITAAEAEALLLKDLNRFEKRVSTLVKVPLNDNQFAALVSFDFNTGELHSSTLLKRLNQGDYASVPSELMKWVKITVKGEKVTSKGLVNRRTSEAALWRSKAAPVSPAPVAPVAKHWLAALFDTLLALFGKAKS